MSARSARSGIKDITAEITNEQQIDATAKQIVENSGKRQLPFKPAPRRALQIIPMKRFATFFNLTIRYWDEGKASLARTNFSFYE